MAAMYNTSRQRMEVRHTKEMQELERKIEKARSEQKREFALRGDLETELEEELMHTDKLEEMLNSVCKYVETRFQQEATELENTEREHAESFAEAETRLRLAYRDEIANSEESAMTRKKLVNVVLEMNQRDLEIRKQNLVEVKYVKEISNLKKKRNHFHNELAATKSLLEERESRHAQEIELIRNRGSHLAHESETHLNELNARLESAQSAVNDKIEDLSRKCFEITLEAASRRTEEIAVWKEQETNISEELSVAKSEERQVQEELNECVSNERARAIHDATEMRALEHRLALSRVEYQDAQRLEFESLQKVDRSETESQLMIEQLENRAVRMQKTVLEEQIACEYHKKAVQDLASRLVAQIPLGRLRQDMSNSLSPIPTPPSSPLPLPLSPRDDLRRRLSSSDSLPPGRLLNTGVPSSSRKYGPPGIAPPPNKKSVVRVKKPPTSDGPPGKLRNTSVVTLDMIANTNKTESLQSRGLSVFGNNKEVLERPPGRVVNGWSPATVKYRKSMSNK